MSAIHIDGVKISAIIGVLPENIESNLGIGGISEEESARLIKNIGIQSRHIAAAETCASDLAFDSAEILFDRMGWDRSDVDLILFVSQTGDYIRPSTSCILHDLLGLRGDCIPLDLPMGCAGSVNALATASSILQQGGLSKALVLTGETSSKFVSPTDRSLRPLSGDGACAIALEASENSSPMVFDLRSAGENYKDVYVPEGGYRQFLTEKSFDLHEVRKGLSYRGVDAHLDGTAVFTFSITKPIELIREFCEETKLVEENIDYFVFHQANKIINDTIVRRLKIDKAKVPTTLETMGNTSGTSIPITLCSALSAVDARDKPSRVLACGFGSGLCWGVAHFEVPADALVEMKIVPR